MEYSGFIQKVFEKLDKLDQGRIKEIIKELSTEKELYKLVFDSMIEGVIVTNWERKVIFINRAMEQFISVPREKVLNIDILDSKFFDEEIKSILDTALAKEEKILEKEIHVLRNDNRFLLTLLPLTDEDQDMGQIIILVDITEKKRKELQLRRAESLAALTTLSAGVAHEIKNPLTPMKLSIQLLQKTWYDKTMPDKDFENRLNKVAQTLIEQINTLSSIASEFSAFAKMPKTRNEEVEIVKKLKNVTALFENENNIDISLKLNGIEELYIIADKEQVSRVFINLVKNAMQAIPKSRKGKILIQLEKGKNKAIIIIEDNGEGISEQQKKRLFEPSFTTKTTGMGIGLAIVKNIITAAGGNIRFESSKNKGAKFFVEFITV